VPATQHLDAIGRPTVCLTFDVDGEAGLGREAAAAAPLITTSSERRFGPVRGLPRILDLLASLGIHATFYVPGATVELHRDRITAIVERGHEVGHHGHRHLPGGSMTAAEERSEIEDGLAALAGIGVTPAGYRSPGLELTTETLDLLLEYEFRYDSSCMGDDRPYWEGPPGRQLLELPVHWSLDDWPFFGSGPDQRHGSVETWRRTWSAEVDQAMEEGRPVTLTMHPELIGRGYRFAALADFVAQLHERGVWFARHADVAALVSRPTEAAHDPR
jgi:peptidoglycan/xylan/chitin deacetylase (PgdA/CDA1 family)